MPKLDLDAIPQTNATGYPAPYDAEVEGRWYRRLTPVAGLTRMGASHVVLKPGAWSSQRHWHSAEDELVVMLAGEAVLVEDPGSGSGAGNGESIVRPGDILAWPAGEENGHHLQNRSDADCVFVAIGAGPKDEDSGEYPDIDMVFDAAGYARKDGTRYAAKRTP
ncbi:cupin domain-containing protein [Alteriqipengyuania lutimaris]|uniref:Cupin domain-containing protein n=1 Tax=Alteriqipengyuania lutimaris TaxID=1538146 RepID=A0A395LHN4_9SPHN|nr:cupin domain-containing protein [Alteriqipengyuania lutimaris]MBB3034758.1 putative cupin superfamily protein [Alteriqipengyuania lutimaris]RDS76393.1 cupin domain-containing protein [Alteriqipengyuania lutimaris]